MYTGHLGIALAAKGTRSGVSLWLLGVAALAPDLIDFSLQAMGYPDGGLWTHSLPASLGFGLVFLLLGLAISHNLASGLVVGVVALSHVLLDLMTSRIRLWPGGPTAGLHWYRRPMVDFAIEAALVIGGWLLYGRSLPRTRRFSPAALAMLLVLLVLQAYMATQDVS